MLVLKPYTTLFVLGMLVSMFTDLQNDIQQINNFVLAFIIIKWTIVIVIIALQIISKITKNPGLYISISNILLVRSYMAFYDITGKK